MSDDAIENASLDDLDFALYSESRMLMEINRITRTLINLESVRRSAQYTIESANNWLKRADLDHPEREVFARLVAENQDIICQNEVTPELRGQLHLAMRRFMQLFPLEGQYAGIAKAALNDSTVYNMTKAGASTEDIVCALADEKALLMQELAQLKMVAANVYTG